MNVLAHFRPERKRPGPYSAWPMFCLAHIPRAIPSAWNRSAMSGQADIALPADGAAEERGIRQAEAPRSLRPLGDADAAPHADRHVPVPIQHRKRRLVERPAIECDGYPQRLAQV